MDSSLGLYQKDKKVARDFQEVRIDARARYS